MRVIIKLYASDTLPESIFLIRVQFCWYFNQLWSVNALRPHCKRGMNDVNCKKLWIGCEGAIPGPEVPPLGCWGHGYPILREVRRGKQERHTSKRIMQRSRHLFRGNLCSSTTLGVQSLASTVLVVIEELPMSAYISSLLI